MPAIHVFLYREDDGTCPVLEWLDALPSKARHKCVVRLERLGELGHELRRPEADFLRDGIYELRIGLQGVNYRMLYFFHGRAMAIVAQGMVKERVVPAREIDLAVRRKGKFEQNPRAHTYEE